MASPGRPSGPPGSSSSGRSSSDRREDPSAQPSAGRGGPPTQQPTSQGPGPPPTTSSGRGNQNIRNYFGPTSGPPPMFIGNQPVPVPGPSLTGRDSSSRPPRMGRGNRSIQQYFGPSSGDRSGSVPSPSTSADRGVQGIQGYFAPNLRPPSMGRGNQPMPPTISRSSPSGPLSMGRGNRNIQEFFGSTSGDSSGPTLPVSTTAGSESLVQTAMNAGSLPFHQNLTYSRPPTARREERTGFQARYPSGSSNVTGAHPQAPTMGSSRQQSPARGSPLRQSQSSSGHPVGLRSSSSGPLPSSPLASQAQPSRPRAPTVGSSGHPSPARGSPLNQRQSSSGHPAGLRSSSSGPLTSSPLSSHIQPARSRAPTVGSQSSHPSARGSPQTPARGLPGSPSSGRGGNPIPPSIAGSPVANPGTPPNRPPASSPTTGTILPSRPHSDSQGQQQQIVYKAFRVAVAITAEDAKVFEQNTRLRGFVAAEVGAFGSIPGIAPNIDKAGNVVQYPLVRLLQHTIDGPQPISGTTLGGGKCRIPLSRIEVGAVITSDLKVVSDADAANPAINQEAINQQSDTSLPLRTFIEGFMASMLTVESRSLLKIYGVPGIVVEQAEKKGSLFVESFLNGMRTCDTLKVFQNGMPSFKDIWNKCKSVSETSSFRVDKIGTYFYLLMYYNEETHEFGVYLGRTKDLDARYAQHSGALQTEKLTLLHYRMGRELVKAGATYRLFPLLFTPDTSNANIFDAWTETILMTLFESFNPVMLGWRRHSPSNKKVEDFPDWGRSAQQDGYLRTYTRPLALMILDIGSQVKNATTLLQRFTLKDVFTGLNWCVPLAEGLRYEANLWIRTTTPATDTEPAMWSFRTLPKRLNNDCGITVFYGNRRTTQPVRFRHMIPVGGTPLGPGSTVNIVVEITKDPNTRHPHSYLQLPTVGPLDCWSEAFRVGIKIEYEDNGDWYMMYLRQNRMFMFSTKYGSVLPDDSGKEIANIDTTWIHMIKIMAGLMNWRWQPENSLTKHIYVPYVNRTRTMEYDFFNQQLVIGTCQITDKPCPRPLTLDQTSDLIEETFGPDVHIGHIPDPHLFLPPNFSADRFVMCDLCKCAPDSSLSPRCKERVVVTTVNGQELLQCPFSAALGRYCTFTEDIKEREDLRDLVYIRIRGYPVQPMAEPPNMFQYLEMRDVSVGEAAEKDGGDG